MIESKQDGPYRKSAVVDEPRAARKGRPRSDRVHRAILDAFRAVLSEEGFADLHLEHVAARAGVGKATIYRRWSSKQELVRDAIAYMHDDIEAPDTGSLLGDYEGLAAGVRAAVQRQGAATFAPRLLGEAVGDPELHAIFYANLIKPRRDQMRMVLERAVARGELRGDLDLDLMIDLFAGPAVYRMLITGGDMSKMFAVEEQIDALFNGLRPPASPRT